MCMVQWLTEVRITCFLEVGTTAKLCRVCCICAQIFGKLARIFMIYVDMKLLNTIQLETFETILITELSFQYQLPGSSLRQWVGCSTRHIYMCACVCVRGFQCGVESNIELMEGLSIEDFNQQQEIKPLNAEMKCPLHFEIYEEDTGRS